MSFTKSGTMALFINKLKHEEGYGDKVYIESFGVKPVYTVGYGHNVEDNPIPIKILAKLINDSDKKESLEELLEHDIIQTLKILNKNLPWWRNKPDKVQIVMLDMCFNLGWSRFSKFKNMIHWLEVGDYVRASMHLMDSRYARQVKNRAERNKNLLKSSRS